MSTVRANHSIAENVTRPRGDHPMAARENGTMLTTSPGLRSGVPILGVLLLMSASPLAVAAVSVEPGSALPALWESSRTSLNLAVDPEGRLWASTPESTFDVYDRDGNLLETWGTFGRDEGQFDFDTPCGPRGGGVAFKPDGGFYVTDADKPENARQLHQLRDLLVRVDDPIGGGTGLGNAETFALGAFPERGLTAENSFL